MNYELADICNLVKEKVKVDSLDKQIYISTENMIPNKGGIVTASSLPTTIWTQSFKIGDILVSNIRPYFKKIWHANFNGGCSNDVLVFRAKENINSYFLYYVLADDTFFDYAMATSKGTKMPRGDKTIIMKYNVPDYSYENQVKISSILCSLDDKIEENEKAIKDFFKKIKIICNLWLPGFESSDSKIPSNWSIIPLSDIADFINGYSYKSNELIKSDIAMATIKNFDRCGGFKLDGYKEIVPSSRLKKVQHIELFDTLVAHTDLTQNSEIIGNAEIITSKSDYKDIIFSMDLVKVLPKSKQISKFIIAALLQSRKFKAHCLGYVNGTTVLHLSKKALPEYKLILPSDLSILKPLDEIITLFYKQISIKVEETRKLEQIKNILLPKLMSGKIDISDIDI